MIDTSTNIIRHKKTLNYTIQPNTIIKFRKLISLIKTSQQSISSSNLKKIKIKSKIRNRNGK